MFKLTLQYIALGWFETEAPTLLTEDQMKTIIFFKGLTLGETQDVNNKTHGTN